MVEFLKGAIGARLNVIVSAGTGAGRTTLLNVLSGFTSSAERIITIEDAAELTLRQRHAVPMNTGHDGSLTIANDDAIGPYA